MIFPPEMHWLHGLRTGFSTLMNERGFESQLIELQLSHRKRDAVASIYDRCERIPERRKLMQERSDFIDELRGYQLPLTQISNPNSKAVVIFHCQEGEFQIFKITASCQRLYR